VAASDITPSYAGGPGCNRPEEELALAVSFHDSIRPFQANAKVTVAISEQYPTASFHISDNSLFADCLITEAVQTKVLTLSFHDDDDDDDDNNNNNNNNIVINNEVHTAPGLA
jgi:hypothetical protein